MEVDNIETLPNHVIVADSNQEMVVETSKIIDSDDESSLDDQIHDIETDRLRAQESWGKKRARIGTRYTTVGKFQKSASINTINSINDPKKYQKILDKKVI